MTHCQEIDGYITLKDFLCFPTISLTTIQNSLQDRELDRNKNSRVPLINLCTNDTIDNFHTFLQKQINL